MAYLGLDLSTNTGWATWALGEPRPHLGTLKLARRDPDELAPDFERLRVHLSSLHAIDPITHVWYEAPIMMPTDKIGTLRLLLGLANMVEWWSYKLGIPCRQALMGDWRKHFLGFSTGGRDFLKKKALEECKGRGWPAKTHDEAEAAGVLDYGLSCIRVRPPWRDEHLFNGLKIRTGRL